MPIVQLRLSPWSIIMVNVMRETVNTAENNLVAVIHKVNGERHLTLKNPRFPSGCICSFGEHVDELLVCNPTYVAKKSGAKTDFRDAPHLAQELRTNHLKPVFHDSSHWSEIRVSVSGYLI